MAVFILIFQRPSALPAMLPLSHPASFLNYLFPQCRSGCKYIKIRGKTSPCQDNLGKPQSPTQGSDGEQEQFYPVWYCESFPKHFWPRRGGFLLRGTLSGVKLNPLSGSSGDLINLEGNAVPLPSEILVPSKTYGRIKVN